jgi:hypothetical protein
MAKWKIRLQVILEFVPDEIEKDFNNSLLVEIRQELESIDI